MASEKVDNLKEYVIKLIRHELMFQGVFGVKRCKSESEEGRSVGG